jgi:hypothetical protein
MEQSHDVVRKGRDRLALDAWTAPDEVDAA